MVNPNLNDLAALNASLLAALDGDSKPATIKALADAIGRAPTNVGKSLDKLEAAGLVVKADLALTHAGLNELARVRHLLDGEGEAGEALRSPEGEGWVTWSQIAPSPLNPRKDFDSEEAQAAIAELAESIADEGLLQNLVVKRTTRTEEGVQFHEIVAGERRWRAIGLLVEQGRWPADRPIPVQIREVTELEHRQMALAENLKRRNLNPIEEAKAFQGLVDAGVKTADLAKAVNVSQRMIQQRLQLLDLPDAVQADVAAGTMTIEQGRKEAQALNALKLDLEPPVLLALAELAVKIATDPERDEDGEPTDSTFVADDTPLDADVYLTLRNANLVFLYHRQGDAHESTARLGWNTERRLLHTRPELVLDDPATLTQLRTEAFIARDHGSLHAEEQAVALHVEGKWATPWLNGPFTLPPEAEAEMQAQAAEEAERKAEQDRVYQRNVAARQAEAAARAAVTPRAVTLVGDLLREQAKALPAEPFAEIFAAYGNPLPWTVRDTGQVQNADGVVFGWQWSQGATEADMAYGMLRLIAVNAAGGFPTPPIIVTPKPEPVEDPHLAASLAPFVGDDDDDQVATEDEDQLEDA